MAKAIEIEKRRSGRSPENETKKFYNSSSWDESVQREAEWLIHERSTVTLAVIADPYSRNRVVMLLTAKDETGTTHAAWIHPAAGWMPPAGKLRTVRLMQTNRGTVYAIPAAETAKAELAKNEDQRDREHHLRAKVLWDDRENIPVLICVTPGPAQDMRLAFDKDQLALWREHGEEVVGRTVELNARPVATTFIARPRRDWKHLGVTNETEVNETAEALQKEREAAGLLRFSFESLGGKDREYTVAAISILGIGSDGELAEPLVKAMFHKRLKKAEVEWPTIQGLFPGITKEKYLVILKEAKRIVDHLVTSGNVLPAWQVPETNGGEPPAPKPPPKIKTVRCPHCKEENHLTESQLTAERSNRRCNDCGRLLEPFTKDELGQMTVKELVQLCHGIGLASATDRLPKAVLVDLLLPRL